MHWIYHKTSDPKVINFSDYESHKAEGWADSPAQFVKVSDFGADASNKEQVQALGETIQGVRDRLNAELNFDIMSKKELARYAKTHFNFSLVFRKSLKLLRQDVRELAGV